MIEMVEDDDDFLSQVAKAEAEAISDKRRRIHSIDSDDNYKRRKREEVTEGLYMAALRGSNSLRWQKLNSITNSTKSRNQSLNPLPQYKTSSGADFDEIPQKNCPCGLGVCVVFTANTERNQGRKFYKCPVRQENGGCVFFEWCDNNNSNNSNHYNTNNNASDFPCPCGAGFCPILTAKTGKNIGQQFYRCPANQGSSCGFFKWCNDNVTAASGHLSSVSNSSNTMNDISNKSFGVRAGSSCFKCGNEGHWAKDCPNLSSEPPLSANSKARTAASYFPAGGEARTVASGTCYKCGKSGHWANNCTSVSGHFMNVSQK